MRLLKIIKRIGNYYDKMKKRWILNDWLFEKSDTTACEMLWTQGG